MLQSGKLAVSTGSSHLGITNRVLYLPQIRVNSETRRPVSSHVVTGMLEVLISKNFLLPKIKNKMKLVSMLLF